ncbi:MAG: aminopeptidase P family protein [Prevotellaceae bacterium]|jgi:Xaa-Pro aminopeptidase|nr:aminopeptidase P family protein [Prevotellaceae bacterium]
MFDTKVYVERRNKLRKMFRTGLLLFVGNGDSPMNYHSNQYRFRQDSTFLYYWGINYPDCAAVIDIEKDTECLYINDVDIDDIIWMGPQELVKEKGARVGVNSVYPLKDLFTTINNAVRLGRKIHFLPQYRQDNAEMLSTLLGIKSKHIKNYVSQKLIKAVVDMRSVKDEYEIEEIEKACNIGYKMHTTVMKMCKPGMMEYELAGVIEGITIANNGYISFPVILSQNVHTLHNHNHSQKLTENRMLITDAGAENEMNYCSDFTRTIPVNGKFTQKQKDIYNIVLAANAKAIELAKPDVTYQSIHLEIAKIITRGLCDLGIMRGDIDEAVQNGAHALFLPHGLGHMMGLDVHDMENLGEDYVGYDDEIVRSTQFGTSSLRMGRRLQKGFVVTDEPGIYFIPELIEKWKNEKINKDFINYEKVSEYTDVSGVRIEDDLLITENGCRLLGKKRIPVTVKDIEDIMKKED